MLPHRTAHDRAEEHPENGQFPIASGFVPCPSNLEAPPKANAATVKAECRTAACIAMDVLNPVP